MHKGKGPDKAAAAIHAQLSLAESRGQIPDQLAGIHALHLFPVHIPICLVHNLLQKEQHRLLRAAQQGGWVRQDW